MPSAAIVAIAITVYTALAFGCGFLISDWRSNGEIEKLKGTNSVLQTVNGKCAADVQNAAIAMAAMKHVTQELERQAASAMREAAPQVERRTATITKIKALPSVALDQQCEAIKREQIEYVQKRRDG